MNGFPSESTLKYYRTIYPPGTRIHLDEMHDLQAIPAGTKGEILGIDDAGNALMKWDNGRLLSLATAYGNLKNKLSVKKCAGRFVSILYKIIGFCTMHKYLL